MIREFVRNQGEFESAMITASLLLFKSLRDTFVNEERPCPQDRPLDSAAISSLFSVQFAVIPRHISTVLRLLALPTLDMTTLSAMYDQLLSNLSTLILAAVYGNS